jgi:uncharacterized membrane protein YoaK (UPF0700 family)
MMLAFMSGTINAGGFLACGRFVTHVTGFAAFLGIDVANGEYALALGMLVVPLIFLLGSFVSGGLIDVRIREGREPRYDLVMLMVTTALVLSAVGGNLGWFGVFQGEGGAVQADIGLIILLCFASGLQNALISTSSGAVIRTTHLTGLTTDLGIGLAKALSAPDAAATPHELVNNKIRAGIIGSFVLGSAAGTFAFLRLEYWAFLIPALISLYATQLVFRYKKKRR